MYPERLKIYRNLSKGLHRIGVHPCAILPSFFCNRWYILNYAGLIIR